MEWENFLAEGWFFPCAAEMIRNWCSESGEFKKSWGGQDLELVSGCLQVSPGEREEEEVSVSDPLSACVFSNIPISHLE